MKPNDEILAAAEFDTRLPRYFMVQALFGMLVSIILIPLLPVWFILGRAFHQKQYDALSCHLTSRSLNLRRGVLFKVQKSIPLDKITDLAVNEGPILRFLGLCSLQIETAGGGQGSNMGHAMLPGVVDAEGFRDRVLAQRDLVAANPAAGAPATIAASLSGDVLIEIRDTLQRIEAKLGNS